MRRRHPATLRHSALVFTAAALSACGGHSSGSSSNHSGADASAANQELVQNPPRGYYDALVANAMQLIDASSSIPATATPAAPAVPAAKAGTNGPVAAPAAVPAQLWLNFGGATVSKGYGPGMSFLLCQDSATIKPFAALTTADQATIVAGVQAYYTAAKANLMVTATKPASGDYTTVIVGGTIADLGCTNHGEFGASPLDVGNANKNDIAFAFAKDGISDQQLAVNIAHLTGHTYGLANVSDSYDIMAVTPNVNAVGFGTSAIVGDTALQNEPLILVAATTPSTAVEPAPAGAGSEGTLPPILASIPGIEVMVTEVSQKSGDGSLIPLIKTIVPLGKAIDPAAITSVLSDNGIPAGSVNTIGNITNNITGNGNNVVNGDNVNITINVINNITTTTTTTTGSSEGGRKKKGCGSVFNSKGSDTSVGATKTTTTTTTTANSSGSTTNAAGSGGPMVAKTTGTGTSTAANAGGSGGAAAADPKTTAAATVVAPADGAQIAALLNSIEGTLALIAQHFSTADQSSLANVLKASCAHGYLSVVGNLN